MEEAAIPVPLHPVLQAYAARTGFEPAYVRDDGGLAIVVDGRYRVVVVPGTEGRLVLTSVLKDLVTVGERRRGEFLEFLMRIAAGLLRDHASTLSIDESGHRLLLQQVQSIAAQPGGLEAEVAEFVNVLAFWHSVMEQEARRFDA